MHVRAPAKINLTLDVLDRRPDGYHDIRSVMQTIDLHDCLQIELTDRPGRVELTVENNSNAAAPDGEANIACRAARAVLASAGAKRGAEIVLRKHVPQEAGLGGGSSDAAAVIAPLNRLLGSPLTYAQMVEIGLGLGADVPFFLTGGLCVVDGGGERVTALADRPSRKLVIVKPPVGVSTAAAYAALDHIRSKAPRAEHPPWDGHTLRNDFQAQALATYPKISAAMEALRAAGCEQTLLCGSGSAVFGMVARHPDPAAEDRRADEHMLAATQAGVGAVFLARTIGPSEMKIV